MTGAVSSRDVLARECEVLCRHLSGIEPTAYVIEKYIQAHEVGSVDERSATPFDRRLLDIARRGVLPARVADSYASLLARGSLLRRKLALLLAILESSGQTHLAVDSVGAGGRMGFILRLVPALAGFAAALAAGLILVAPVRIACALSRSGRSSRPAAPRNGGRG